MVADSDGYNPQRVASSPEPLLSPAWSPDGRKLAYVSFENGNSEIFIQDISTGAREKVSSFRGINSGPAFSPDGRWLALGLADGATTNVWALSTQDGSWRQMTDFGEQPTVIARQVAWSPDGAYVFAAVSKNIGDIVMFDGLV